ncbi:MAG: hypothetical protein JWN10_2719 [Solirubrobacterales bacterium]|nr:hypothetical protein [Solirubrobacterales bacterium]
MSAGRRIPTAERLAQRKRKIMRTELGTGIGCAVLGVLFLTGEHTLREMSLFLLGWAAGCAFHLTQTLIVGWTSSRPTPGAGGDDAED